MNIFMVSIFLITFYAIVFKFIIKSKLSKEIFVFLTTLQLILIQGLRDKNVGTDLMRYHTSFIESGQQSLNEVLTKNPQELSYAILEHLIYKITGNYQVFLLVISIFSLVVLGQFILKFSLDPYLSYIIYIVFSFFDFGFSGLTQTIAISFTILAFQCLINKNTFFFITFILFAATFHLSALIFLAVYPLQYLKWRLISLIMGTISLVLWYVFRIPIGNLTISSTLYNQYQGYLEVSGGIGTISIFLLLFVILGVLLIDNRQNEHQEYRFLTNIIILSLFIQILSSVSYMFTRLNFYFLIYIIIFIPLVFSLLITKIKEKRLIEFITFSSKIFLVLLLLNYYSEYLTKLPYGILPYYFFWEI